MIYFDAGDDLVAGGKTAGAAAAKDYEEHRYHGPKDEYDPNWNWAGTVRDVQLYYSIGRALAESDAWPNWVAGDEFRAIRDRSRATARSFSVSSSGWCTPCSASRIPGIPPRTASGSGSGRSAGVSVRRTVSTAATTASFRRPAVRP